MAEAQAQPAYPKGLDFEQVWAALMENREQIKETDRIGRENAERFDRQMEESKRQMEESRRQMEESRREWEKSNREWNKRFGDLGRRFGEIAEYMVAPNLREKFKELGFIFPKANSNSNVRDYDNNIFFEVDIMLENGDKAMLVEVKSKPSTEDVKDHIERLEKMRKYADLHDDKRTFLGAVAGVVMADNVKEYVLKQGFFVIEPSGETFNIIPPNGEPKEW